MIWLGLLDGVAAAWPAAQGGAVVPNDWLAAQPRWVMIAMIAALVGVAVVVIVAVRAARKPRRAAPRATARRPGSPRAPRQQIEVLGPGLSTLEGFRRL